MIILFAFLVPKIQLGQAPIRTRTTTENNFADTEVEELIAMLRETENLEEQGDILQYLVDTQGLDYNTGMFSNFQMSSINRKMHSSMPCEWNGETHIILSFMSSAQWTYLWCA